MNIAKGVVCDIWPDERMPVDKNGVRAHLIMDPLSILKRLNIGTWYEHYFNGACRKVESMISNMNNKEAWDKLNHFFSIISEPHHEALSDFTTDEDKNGYVQDVKKDGIHLYLPPWSPSIGQHTIRALIQNGYDPEAGSVSYGGFNGQQVVTKDPVLVANIYIILLDKIGEYSTAVTGAKLQQNGVPSKIQAMDRHSNLHRKQPVRFGETEMRLLTAIVGPRAVANLLDWSNNPDSHKYGVRNLLDSEDGINIKTFVDRKQLPLGGHRPLQLLKNLFECSGVKFKASGKK